MKSRVDALNDWPKRARMDFAEIGNAGVTLQVVLATADEATAHALAAFREAVSQKTTVRHPNHESYRFHISLAYRIAALGERESADLEAFRADTSDRLVQSFGTLTMPMPALVCFDDMYSFPTARGA